MIPNLALRVPGPVLRRLSEDMQEMRGHSALPAGNFADSARFAGTCCLGVTATGQFAVGLPQEQVEAVGAFRSPTLRRPSRPRPLPSGTSSRPCRRTCRHGDEQAAAAMDGKELHGASKQAGNGRCMKVAAVQHGSGPVTGQVDAGSRSNGIRAVRDLARRVGAAGRTATLDAMHAQQETARSRPDCGADRALAAVKEPRKGILAYLKAVGFDGTPAQETVDEGHGRAGRRRCAVVDLSGPRACRAQGPPRPPPGGCAPGARPCTAGEAEGAQRRPGASLRSFPKGRSEQRGELGI